MTISTVIRPSVHAAFNALIDYAGLFPPARLSLEQARREYAAARSGDWSWVLGRFIVPASLLDAIPETLEAPLSVIADEGGASLPALERRIACDARIEALEVPPEIEVKELRAGLGDRVRAPVFVEIERSTEQSATMRELARYGYGAKLRCGGLSAEAFPSVDDVADFISAANAVGVAFKATAGLHHPVRHRDPSTEFMMHGFLNVLAAAALAPRVNRVTLERILAEEDASAFAFDETTFRWRNEILQTADLERTRRDAFVAYGSCSFAEPIDDLTALGILPPR